MRKKNTWLSLLGAVLILSAAPVVYGVSQSTTTKTSTKKTTSKSAKSKRKSKRQPKASTQKAPTPDRIKDIQSALQREGAYEGEPTGKWDDSTVEAMKKYQDKNGLSPTGKIDALTLNKLGLGAETAGKGAPVPTASSSAPADPPAK